MEIIIKKLYSPGSLWFDCLLTGLSKEQRFLHPLIAAQELCDCNSTISFD